MSGIQQSSPRRHVPAALALAAVCVVLAGCGPMIASVPLIGEPPEAQKNRPEVQPAYPGAFRPPADPEAAKAMSAAERARAQTDLQTARDRAATQRREQIKKPPSRPSD